MMMLTTLDSSQKEFKNTQNNFKPIFSPKNYSKELPSMNQRASSVLKPARSRLTPFSSSFLPKERKLELATRFGFSNSQLQTYEKLVYKMRKMGEEEKSDLISELLRQSNIN